ncbi:MAG TPA: twin-arginine translocase subunit TatC [Candidatus Acidoferrales bacterium]|nr:twin-arginine translocase subunit TatC [Candidatus Acidoferrales bacterium]
MPRKSEMATPSQSETVVNMQEEEDSGGKMSLFEHLVELRKRLLHSVGAVGIGMVVGLAASRPIMDFILRPIQAALRANHLDDNVFSFSLQGYVGLYINLGLYIGLALAMPYVLYQVWLFVAPGLYKHEQKAVSGFIVSSMILFLCGVAFAYFVLLPTVLTFLVSFVNHGPVRPLISLNEYFELVLVVLVGLGVIFELPVLVFILSVFGIVTPQWLWKNLRYAIVIITVVAAVVTPTPDATTMLIFMAPMVGLYFVGIGVSYMVYRKKRQKQMEREGTQ